MPFDGFVTKSLQLDLNKHIKNAKINNVYQHNNHDISVHLRNFGKNLTLFISTHPNFCRIHLTDIKHENPDHPPSFCMLLRKYLKGGTIKYIKQYEGDRILDIFITHQDEFGLEKELILTVEIMGKHSNLILVNKKTKRILDGLKRIKREFSNMREIIPGNLFERPPGQNKENPWEDDLNPEALLKTIDEEIKTEDLLFNHFQGVSPLLSRELAYGANLVNTTANELTKSQLEVLINELNKLKTQILSDDIDPILLWDVKKEKLVDFYLIPLSHISFPKECKKAQTSIMKAVDNYFYTKETEDKKNSLENELNKKINHLLKKSKKKLKKQQKEYDESENAERYKIFGELLTANLYRFSKEKPLSNSIEVTNYYEDPPKTIKISLDKSLSPSDNAQRYFKKYQKAKIRNKKLKKEIKNTESEIKYLENISFQLENAEDLEELEAIKEELVKEGYLSEKKQDIKKKKKADPGRKSHLEFVSKDGFKILVGKNNKQNDYLTLKEASSEDIWLHTKEIAGSHVVIKGKDAPLSTIEEAASIAAYYSKGKNSSNVPVDYTRIKHVRKPKGAKPGMVFYDNHKTLFVDPVKPAD